MKRWKKFKAALLAVAACGACNGWAQVYKPEKSFHYMENPVLPAPPPAKEEQLRRGEELLSTLLKIAANVRLTDSIAVMQELGVDELSIWRHPTHFWIAPKRPVDPELKNRGFENLSMVQKHDPYAPGGRSSLSITLRPDVICVTPQAMEKRLEDLQRGLWTRTEVHPVPKPPKQQPFDGIYFSPLNTPDGRIGSISAEFSYQECATGMSLGYPSLKSTEIK